LEIVDEETK